MKPTFRSGRVTLRPHAPSDLPALLELDADPEVRRFVDAPTAPTLEDVLAYTTRWQAMDLDTPAVGYWVAELDGRFVGWAHLRPPRAGTPQAPGDLELGYRFRREAWGQGVSTACARLLVDHAFQDLGAPRVTAMALTPNRASTRVMEKVGLSLVEAWTYPARDGARLPAVLYALPRAAWASPPRPLRVLPVPCLRDNYAYLLIDDGRAVVVDPSEAAPVNAALAAAGSPRLEAIWCTHHHLDHVGGVEALVAEHGAEVVGSRHDGLAGRIPGQTREVEDGDSVVFAGRAGRVHAIPGHTLGAVAFEIDGELFTGDTLFAGGCGRLFEGTPAMMQASLAKLAALHPGLRVHPGHEYTVNNLAFAASLGETFAVGSRLAVARSRRQAGAPAVGGTLAEELVTNPFLRWADPDVQAAARTLGAPDDAPASVFAALRAAKDRW